MTHLVLLGDSIFDNAPYVQQGQDVCSQLRAKIERAHPVSLLARDGSVLADMAGQVRQLRGLPSPPDRLFLSCGGNDVLALVGAMQTQVGSVLAGVELLAQWIAAFRRDYREVLELLMSTHHSLVVATIYDAVPGLSPGLRAALATFNDVIVREATRCGLPILDLRFVCSEASDFSAASPIEPSEAGAAKIAAAIANIALFPENAGTRSTIFTGVARPIG